MIENALFSRVREKQVLNGVQMEYGDFWLLPKRPATIDCQRNFRRNHKMATIGRQTELNVVITLNPELEYIGSTPLIRVDQLK